MPRLNDIFPQSGSRTEITGLTADSRAVGPGYLFAALPGAKADGGAFIADAIAKGASVVLVKAGTAVPAGVEVIKSADPRRDFAMMASRFFGRQPDIIAAVTGTNGKTSVANFTRQIWARLGHAAGSIGTLGVFAPGVSHDGGLTTPDPVKLHEILAELADAGVTHAAMEASSHGLDQRRLEGVRLQAAAFTNLTRDHLDYHGSMEAYGAAKLRLFSELLPQDGAVVANADSDFFGKIAEAAALRKLRLISFGRAQGADIRMIDQMPQAEGQFLDLSIMGQERRLRLPLAGSFQAENALCALGLVIACGGDAKLAADALQQLEGVPGRLQPVGQHNGGAIYVDYAHTPDALHTALKALRPHCTGRLIAVFGAGGDRDPGKRPLMGDACRLHADISIVTDDNPRSEDPATIRAQVMATNPAAIDGGDRAGAIRQGIAMLKPGDILVVAGKGHEQGQTIAGKTLPFDDVAECRKAMAKDTRGAA